MKKEKSEKQTDYKRMNPKTCPPLPFIEKDEIFYSKKDDSFIVWNGKKFIEYVRKDKQNKRKLK